ncbi:MAG TPA: phage minor capsid protein [Planctomycetota bacterium]|jgi:hypothetical protein
MATQQEAAASVERVMRALLAKLEPLLVERDGNKIVGDVRRAKLAAARIRELLDRLRNPDQLQALGGALAASYEEGYVAANAAGLLQGGAGLTPAIDKNVMLELGRIAADPLAAALSNATSPLPFIAPKMLPEKQAKLAELVMEANARGLTWGQTAKLIQKELPETGKPVQSELIRGAAIELENGFVISAEKYAHMLARTTTVWANNKGTLDYCDDAGIETVKINIAPGAIDFCLELEGKVFALTEEAAKTFDVPLLADCPNGGPPFHPNCRHSPSPFVMTKKQAGKVPVADDAMLTRGEKSPVASAQKAFLDKLEKDPTKYAARIAETAARQGFGSRTVRLTGSNKTLAGEPIPGIVGTKEFFPAKNKSAWAEDVHLTLRMEDSGITSRKEYRQRIADTLRAGAGDPVVSLQGRLIFHDPKARWVAIVQPVDGEVVTAYPLGSEDWQRDYVERYK